MHSSNTIHAINHLNFARIISVLDIPSIDPSAGKLLLGFCIPL